MFSLMNCDCVGEGVKELRTELAALAAHDAGTLALAPNGTLPVPEGTLIEVTLRGRYFLTDQSKRAFIRNGPGHDIFLDSIDYLSPVVRLAAPQPETKPEGGVS